jgi:Protein of unknown function (DUF1493)
MFESDVQIAKRVIAIVAHNRALKPSKINLQTDLYKDLGLTGDDVDDLFGELHRRLEIDFSDFQFGRHFTSEGLFLFSFSRRWKHERLPVTIADLVAAAKCKKWTMNYEGKAT